MDEQKSPGAQKGGIMGKHLIYILLVIGLVELNLGPSSHHECSTKCCAGCLLKADPALSDDHAKK